MFRILLINPNHQQAADIKFLLQLNNYQVEVCETLEEGINRFQIFLGMDRGFDLVLAVTDDRLMGLLKNYAADPFAGRLIVVHERRARARDKQEALERFPVCDPRLVLDCVKYHLEKVKSGEEEEPAASPRCLDTQSGPKHF